MPLDVKLKGPPNEDLVQGYPGIPATWPRVAGTLEIRHIPASAKESAKVPLQITKVSVAVMRTDSIIVPSHRPSVTSQKREKSFLITRQKDIYKSDGSDMIYALDVPFTLSLPTSKPPCASISLPKMLESTNRVFVTIDLISSATHNNVTTTWQFPLRIRRFDTLGTFGVFSEPVSGELTSSDHMASLVWSLPVSAYGPGDKISISLHTPANSDWSKAKKVKLKRLSVELVQVTKFFVPHDENNGDGSGRSHDETVPMEHASSHSANGGDKSSEHSEVIETRTRIAKTARDFTSAEQDERLGMTNPLELELPVPSLYHSDSPSGVLPKESPLVGYSGKVPFTNTSSLYSIDFKLLMKARFSHAKDIEAEQPLTISQFDHVACLQYMCSLVEAARRLKHTSQRTQPPNKWVDPPDTAVRIA